MLCVSSHLPPKGAFGVDLPATLAVDFPTITAISQLLIAKAAPLHTSALRSSSDALRACNARNRGTLRPYALPAASTVVAVLGMSVCMPHTGSVYAPGPAALSALAKDAVGLVPYERWASEDHVHLFEGDAVR